MQPEFYSAHVPTAQGCASDICAFCPFIHLSISYWNVSWYNFFSFFSFVFLVFFGFGFGFFLDGKKENKLSDIFYNSHQMFRSKHVKLNNQGLWKTHHHVHEWGQSSRHPKFKLSEAQAHTLPAGHFCQQCTFALWPCIRCSKGASQTTLLRRIQEATASCRMQ